MSYGFPHFSFLKKFSQLKQWGWLFSFFPFIRGEDGVPDVLLVVAIWVALNCL
uniref:Uncharacterized protein n=1 Tax=Manihot esculenta TaxID=3983 RepID=A0A2C9VWM4_MANES